jgi:hypothetical protein
MANIILNATLSDLSIALTLDPPMRGCQGGPGIQIPIPDDWMTRCLSGKHVEGCNHASLKEDGSLYVSDTVIGNSTNPDFTKLIDSTLLTAFLGKMIAPPPIIDGAPVDAVPATPLMIQNEIL